MSHKPRRDRRLQTPYGRRLPRRVDGVATSGEHVESPTCLKGLVYSNQRSAINTLFEAVFRNRLAWRRSAFSALTVLCKTNRVRSSILETVVRRFLLPVGHCRSTSARNRRGVGHVATGWRPQISGRVSKVLPNIFFSVNGLHDVELASSVDCNPGRLNEACTDAETVLRVGRRVQPRQRSNESSRRD